VNGRHKVDLPLLENESELHFQPLDIRKRVRLMYKLGQVGMAAFNRVDQVSPAL